MTSQASHHRANLKRGLSLMQVLRSHAWAVTVESNGTDFCKSSVNNLLCSYLKYLNKRKGTAIQIVQIVNILLFCVRSFMFLKTIKKPHSSGGEDTACP